MPPLEFSIIKNNEIEQNSISETSSLATSSKDFEMINLRGENNGGKVYIRSKEFGNFGITLKDGSFFKTREFTIFATSTDQKTLPSRQTPEK